MGWREGVAPEGAHPPVGPPRGDFRLFRVSRFEDVQGNRGSGSGGKGV